jgi:Protein of unknown function (DUF3037)
MPARAAFDYALIRVVPRVEREEFVNVGAVVFCPTRRFLAAKLEVDRPRLLALDSRLDLDVIEQHLRSIPAICAGDLTAGPMAALPLSERFHWVVSPRSTVVQTSPVHAGLTEDPAAALDHLVATMVRPPG